MLEDSTLGMEKKAAPRQSTVTKPNGNFERKNDPNSTVRNHGRYNKKREFGGNGRGPQPDLATRKPLPQKSRTTVDKRPRQRGGVGDRQREEVAESEALETESYFDGGFSKKGNLNHLLNFKYTTRENVVGSTVRPRGRGPRGPVFNKERYMQANCQFVVKDSGDYAAQAADPDALVDWDLVEQVRTFSHGQTTCPICIQPPSAGKITRCGHVYCWPCILHYLSLDDKSWRRCPICYEAVHKSDLHSVKVVEKKEHKVGDTITLQLMKREKGSTYSVPLAHWQDREGRPHSVHDELNTEYAKVLVASAAQIQSLVIDQERRDLENHLASAEPSEVCFIETALVALAERESALQGKAQAVQENAQLMEQLEAASSGDHGNKNGSGERKGSAPSTAAGSVPMATASLPRNVSFDGSKIRKQYADAFDELEDPEEESTVSGELTDHEDEEEEETDSLVSMSSPRSDLDPSLPLAIPGAVAAVSIEDDLLSHPSDDGSAVSLAEEEAAEQLAEDQEAAEQLALPADPDGMDDDSGPRRGRNLSKRYFYFYQASDAQHIYMHSLNARCIIHEYGSLEHGPQSITAKIVAKDITFMKEMTRQRNRYLSHMPLTCEYQVVELDLQPPVLSERTLRHFSGDLKKRVQQRQKVKRDDRRQARKQRIEERMSYGIYPEVQLALDSPHHFPAPASDVAERRRQSSLSDATSLPSPVNPSVLELNANAAEFVPKAKVDNSPPVTQSAFSFAAALKKAKQPAASAWGSHSTTSTAPTAQGPLPPPPRRVDSEESDNEDRQPVPSFQNSFSAAISSKLDKLDAKQEDGQGGGKKGKKKKKKEPTLLFSTSMMRK